MFHPGALKESCQLFDVLDCPFAIDLALEDPIYPEDLATSSGMIPSVL